MLKEWIVTLHRKEDLESFYEDMETPGGNLFIPNRAVEVCNRRAISRNTHYMLTHEEAQMLKADDRIWDVELAELIEITTRPSGYTITNGQFDKNWAADTNDKNWGLLRQSESSNRANWGDDGTPNITSNLTITASGKNVDVVIFDGHINPAHPEFAVNPDGSGDSRVVQYNWLQNNIGSGTGTYVYTPYVDAGNADRTSDNNHGCHVAGTVAGNTQGWARDANIYNISIYGTNPNNGVAGFSSSTYWDYVRVWHINKPVNPVTGRKNPTITNHSYGSSITIGANDFGNVTKVTYRGVVWDPGRNLTLEELRTLGFYANNINPVVPYFFTSRNADIQDAINEGIIVVAAAGNDYWKIVNAADLDYNNTYEATYFGSNFVWSLHRGTGSGAGYAPVITVGAVGNNRLEDKATFSNCGSQVDVFAAGEAIQSSLHSGGLSDPRNSSYRLGKYQGTSMASPQVAGILALLAESWPNMKQAEAQDWLINNANADQMLDTETVGNPMDTDSLQGAANLYARWINQRAINGSTFPQKNFRPRPTTGLAYPRPRIRKRG